VGGTGLYVKALTSEIETVLISPNKELREELESLSIEELQEKLKSINKDKLESLNHSDLFNKRRLIRYIEIQTSNDERITNNTNKKFESLVIGLYCEGEVLKKRIDERVDKRLESGALEEAKELFKNYDSLSRQVKDANGYKQLFSYLKKEISFDEAVYRWKISEYHHAKNQMTWFKKYGDVEWHDIAKKGFDKNIENSLKKFLQ
jgi:tRNA dimethylallyltransferase